MDTGAEGTGFLTHRQVAGRLKVPVGSLEHAIRNGLVPFRGYRRGKYKETWLLHWEDVEEVQQLLRAEAHRELAQPEGFEMGVRQHIYNYTMRVARLRLGLRASDLGEMVGLKVASIRGYEALRNFPPPGVAKRIAEALRMTVEALFPPWLREFRIEQGPSVLTDAHCSYERALEEGLVRPEALPASWMLPSPEEVVDLNLLRERVREVLDTLSPRIRLVLELRFGLDEEGRPRILEEVAAHLGVTKERIRQIESKALRLLRHPSRSRRLRDFLE